MEAEPKAVPTCRSSLKDQLHVTLQESKFICERAAVRRPLPSALRLLEQGASEDRGLYSLSRPVPSEPFEQLLHCLSSLFEVLCHMTTTTCSRDVIPTRFHKDVFSVDGPSIWSIINLSLTDGPSSFKHALVQPLHILDLITFKAPLGLTPSYTSNLLTPYDYYLLFSFMNWLSLLIMNDYNCCSALCKHCLLLLLLSWRLIYKHHFSPTSS